MQGYNNTILVVVGLALIGGTLFFLFAKPDKQHHANAVSTKDLADTNV